MTTPDTPEQVGWPMNTGAPASPSGRREPDPQAVPALRASVPSASKIIPFELPSAEESHRYNLAAWERSGPFNIDQWPEEVAAQSMPTKFISVTDIGAFLEIYEGKADGRAVMDEYARLIDEAIGWDSHFVRLNSRSPKDAYGFHPAVWSGKTAMGWIASSERCLDDAVMHFHARKPLYICLREWWPIRPSHEVRGFAKGGQLIAISRYDYNSPSGIPDAFAPSIWDRASAFYDHHLAAHFADVVFDLARVGADWKLVELNPYGLSDPCLFKTYEAVEQGGVFLNAQAMSAGTAKTEGLGGDSPASAVRQDAPETSRGDPS